MIEVVRRQLGGVIERGSYPPRFVAGDIVICMNNDGISNKLVKGKLYKVGHEQFNCFVDGALRDGRWGTKTKIYISHLNGTLVDGVIAWNCRFDLVEVPHEPSCTICSSECKKEETCVFFISIIKEEAR